MYFPLSISVTPLGPCSRTPWHSLVELITGEEGTRCGHEHVKLQMAPYKGLSLICLWLMLRNSAISESFHKAFYKWQDLITSTCGEEKEWFKIFIKILSGGLLKMISSVLLGFSLTYRFRSILLLLSVLRKNASCIIAKKGTESFIYLLKRECDTTSTTLPLFLFIN